MQFKSAYTVSAFMRWHASRLELVKPQLRKSRVILWCYRGRCKIEWGYSSSWMHICYRHLLLVSSTHWRRDKMAAIFQTTFSDAFSWMKIYTFWLWFDWNLFPRDQLTVFLHWFRKWLGAVQATSHYLNQWWLDYWRIYASLGLNELTTFNSQYVTSIVEAGIPECIVVVYYCAVLPAWEANFMFLKRI